MSTWEKGHFYKFLSFFNFLAELFWLFFLDHARPKSNIIFWHHIAPDFRDMLNAFHSGLPIHKILRKNVKTKKLFILHSVTA